MVETVGDMLTVSWLSLPQHFHTAVSSIRKITEFARHRDALGYNHQAAVFLTSVTWGYAIMFACQECKRRFHTSLAAMRASQNGCPKCGGTDIDLYISPTIPSVGAARRDYGYFGEERDPLAPIQAPRKSPEN